MHQTRSKRDLKRGFTITEVIAVLGILGLLWALLLPVLSRAKASSAETQCMGNLKSIFSALELYRSDHEKSDSPGTSDQMGFPEIAYRALEGDEAYGQKEIKPWWVCKGVAPRPGSHAAYTQMWPPPQGSVLHDKRLDEKWIEHVSKMGSSSIVIQDWNHQVDRPVNDWSVQRSLGLRLDGSVKFQLRRGDSRDYKWWEKG